MSFNLTSSGAIIWKAGANASSTAIASGALLAKFCDWAEAYVCVASKYDWIANWASLPDANIKLIVDEATATLAGMLIKEYDMSGFTNQSEAQVMLNVDWGRVDKIIDLIKDRDYTNFVIAGG